MRRNDLDDEVEPEIRDGESVRVSMMIMDSDAHRPHQLTDAQIATMRRQARADYIQRTCDAWKTAGRDAAQPDMGTRPEEMELRRHLADPDAANAVERQRRDVTAEDVETRRRKIHAEFSQRLSEAWKHRVSHV